MSRHCREIHTLIEFIAPTIGLRRMPIFFGNLKRQKIKKVDGNMTLPLPYIHHRKLCCRWGYKSWVFRKLRPSGGISAPLSTYRYGSAAKGKPTLLNQAKSFQNEGGGRLRRDTETWLFKRQEQKKRLLQFIKEGNAQLFHLWNNNLRRHSLSWEWNHEPF